MYELPLKIQEAVDQYRPVETEGLTLFPIKVRDYGLFQNARPAIDFLQQSLPVRYLSVPLLSAYYAMDKENLERGEPSSGLFYRALLFLALALNYRPEDPVEERVGALGSNLIVSNDDHTVLKAILFEQDGEVRKLTPIQFQRLRPILAAQNGIELTSADANPELVEAERDLAELNGPALDASVHGLISSLAALTRTEEGEIYQWPILKLTRRKEAWERTLNYLIYGFASATGAKFKGGNPVPSPFYDRTDRESGALIDMGSFTGGRQVTVSEGGVPPDMTANPTNP